MNDIVINKVQSIHRCIERTREEFDEGGESFNNDYSRQDAAILNILRACEQTIDLANHIIKTRKMGIPTSSAESFDLLAKKQILPIKLCDNLKKMVGFRNKIIHEYQRLDLKTVTDVINNGLNDLINFTELIQDLKLPN